MDALQQNLYTVKDIYELPEGTRAELIDGMIYMMAAPSTRHQEIVFSISRKSSRYTTKANKAIYQLMVIALRAELQNILHNLKYEKLDNAVDQIQSVTQKYLKIAGD